MEKKTGQVCFGDHCFEVEIVHTFFKKAFGLMFRKNLEPHHGMLFVFKKEKLIPITMYKMRFPLDIVWIDETGRIVHIEKNVLPAMHLLGSTVYPRKFAKYVLELNAGSVNKHDFREGAHLEIKI